MNPCENIPILTSNGHITDYELIYDQTELINNIVFNSTLKLIGQRRGRSAANFIWEDTNGNTFTMFMSSLIELIKHKGIKKGGKVTGNWTFVKRGMNYGIHPFFEKENEYD
jgi:hypothetical protein